jgi:hypothetical protein
MKPKTAAILLGVLVLIALKAQTMLNGPQQVSGIPQLPSHFGFNCTTAGPSTTCEIDRAYMLHLLPIPFGGTSAAPAPGPCADSGGVIVTNEPAAYFCAPTPGTPNLNWIRVAGTNTW